LIIVILTAALAFTGPARAAGTTITVDGTADDATVANLHGNLHCDLREAVDNVNNNGQPNTDCASGSVTPGEVDTIEFNLSGGGAQTITLAASLALNEPVILDGTTEGLYAGVPLVRIDGGGSVNQGVLVNSPSTIKALMVTRFVNPCVLIDYVGTSTDHATLVASYIGTDGMNDLGGTFGVEITGAAYAQVGGLADADRNVISGNTRNIQFDGGADNNTVVGNYIGLTSDGAAVLPGTQSYGVEFTASGTAGATNNRVLFNRIAGSNNVDVHFDSQYDDNNVIQGNYIGTNAAGTSNLGDVDGIVVSAGDNNLIGSTSDMGKRNLIAGMSEIGVEVVSGTGTIVSDNVLGMDASGTAGLSGSGVGIETSSGDVQITENWVANWGTGIWLNSVSTLDSGSSGNCVTGNSVGMDNTTGSAVDFMNNWWGDATGPSGQGTGGGDSIASDDTVNFDPWDTSREPICSAFANFGIASLDFGNQLVGSSRTQIIQLFSAGTIPLNLSDVGVTSSPFSIVPAGTTCSTSAPLAVGAACLIAVKFSPTKAATYSKNFSLGSDSVPATSDITLTGKGVSGTQALKNPGFETDADLNGLPDVWSFANLSAGSDRRDCTFHHAGSCSLVLTGNGVQKTATQVFTHNGAAGDDFTFWLWSQASGVPPGSAYRLQVKLYKGSTVKASKTMNFTVGTHGFQKVSGTFTAPTAYTKVVYKIVFQAASGTAWFDSASLKWAP
jgi:hypothetical protein